MKQFREHDIPKYEAGVVKRAPKRPERGWRVISAALALVVALAALFGCAPKGAWVRSECRPYRCLAEAVMWYGQECAAGKDAAIYISYPNHATAYETDDAVWKLTKDGAYRRVDK